jgi:ABC-2 type transport system ATP-binding protein
MVDLAGEGRTILISSHGIAEVERVASHAAFLSDGRLLLTDSIEGLRKRLVRVRLRFENMPPTPAALGTVLEHDVSSRLWQAVLQDPDPIEMEKLRCREDIFDIEEIPLNLEEMYTALLARFHRPTQARESSNGWDGTSAAVKTPSGLGRSRGEPEEEEEVEPI